tara:strand:+ start:1339 stop:1569 length:231 start_codon:yes stop_codon:yes gene_type:complete
MWYIVFFVVLCLVHIQFKYCTQIGIAALKILETTAIVLVMQLYSQYDEIWESMPINVTEAADHLTQSWKTLADMYS